MIAGSDLHSRLRYTVARQNTAEAALSDRVYDCEKRILRLAEAREAVYLRLATRYLPELNAESVKTTLREVQSEVAKIYIERQARRQALEKEMIEAADRRTAQDARLEELERNRTAKAQEITSLKTRVAEELGGRAEYVALRRSLAAAQEGTRRIRELAESFHAMAGVKARSYESDRVFAYLLRRRYGSPAYRAGFLGRSLDAWAARLVNFSQQKPAYDILHDGPPLITRETADRDARAAELLQSAKAVERESAGRHGLLRALEESKGLDLQKAAGLEEIARAQADWNRKTTERTDLDNTKGSHHVRALERLKTFLKGEEISALKARVGPDELPAMERIASIDAEIRILKADSKALQQEQALQARRLSELREVERHFRMRSYDSTGARFLTGFDFDDYLLGCAAGRFTSAEVCLALDRHRYVEPPAYSSGSSDSFFSSPSSFDSSSSAFSSSDSGSSSSSFDSGSSSSSSFSSDGGSSTGGGF